MSRLSALCEFLATNPYQKYIKAVEPFSFLSPVATPNATDQPLFSIVIPFFNTADKYLNPLFDCLRAQSFQDWELIIADASTDETRADRIQELSGLDSRFHYVRLPGNLGISANTNEALKQARGQFIVFVDHDDTISPHALNEVAAVIADHRDVDVVYSDEDVLSDDGKRRMRPLFKPSWSVHMLLEMNYVNHLSVIRAELIRRIGGFRPELDGAQDYDLLLRIHTLQELTVVHIPKVLYHWRKAENSTLRTLDTKSYAVEAGRVALRDYLDAIGVEHEGVSLLPDKPWWYHCHPRWSCRTDVIVMVSPDARTNRQFEKLLREATTPRWVTPRFVSIPPSADVREHCDASADAVVVIRSMFLPQDSTWLDELVGVLALPQTAAVAPLLMGAVRDRVVDSGWVEFQGQLRPLYPGAHTTGFPLAGPADLVRDVDGLSDAVVAFRTQANHPELFVSGVVDGRHWRDNLVLWSPVRFLPAKVPFGDTRFNDNLVLNGASVVLRKSTWKN
ncbi:MAG: glycosyltransferase [Propionibacteriaceae bacterium]|nr:glycosyltransferase [Propionibacteriaceae bacterium]